VPTKAPGPHPAYHSKSGTVTKSLNLFSLRVNLAISQRVAANGRFWGSNGKKGV
jgi:hypothetical protein